MIRRRAARTRASAERREEQTMGKREKEVVALRAQ
jgi:hypothetical protein